MIALILGITACEYKTHKVELMSGSIIKVFNTRFEHLKSGDTVCVCKSSYTNYDWEVDNCTNMLDTVIIDPESSVLPRYAKTAEARVCEYRVGVIK